MPPSPPRDPKAPRRAWTTEIESIEDRPEDRRTVEVRGGSLSAPMDVEENDETPSLTDDRDTMPPPLPVAEYVQTMMQQAETDDDVEAEPPPSRAPMSWRGEPPLSFRARAPMDSTLPLGGAPLDSDEFARRPLSLETDVTVRRLPLEEIEEIEEEDVDALLTPLSPVHAPLPAPRPAPPRAPTQPSIQRPRHTPPPRPPPRTLTPVVASKPSIGLSLGKPSPPAVTPSKPLPPAPVPKGRRDAAATVPRIVLSSPLPSSSASITRPVTAPPPSKPEDDAEFDSLPFDDLVAASHRSAPPPTVVAPVHPRAPIMMGPQKGPVPAGLRLGKEPLSSFPPVLEEPDMDDDAGIPAVLDVAWAFRGALAGDSGDQRDAVLPGADFFTARTALPPSPPPAAQGDEAIPPLLDNIWVFQKSSYDEANEVTSVGSLEDDPDIDLEPVDEIEARFEEGDFAGALALAERTLAQDPYDERARAAAESARERLIAEYSAELGGRRQVLKLAMTSDEIRWLSLDHRAGFLLSCVDGRITVEEVLDVACMPELDALRILCDLRDRGAIAMEVDQARSTRR